MLSKHILSIEKYGKNIKGYKKILSNLISSNIKNSIKNNSDFYDNYMVHLYKKMNYDFKKEMKKDFDKIIHMLIEEIKL